MQFLIECLLHPLQGLFGIRPPLFGVAVTLFQQLATAAFTLGKQQKVGQQLEKDDRIIDKLIGQALHDLFNTQAQAVTRIITLPDTHGRAGQFVEQAPSGMIAVAEHPLVEQRHLEQRNL
ncbi:hypothetical protein D9M73_160360 [compost metagenome]